MNLANKRILVTGGAGFIGSHLLDKLADASIVVLDDLSSGSKANLAQFINKRNFEFIQGDIRDRDIVRESLKSVDVVFHLAARGVRHSIRHPIENHDVNAHGTLLLLEEAYRAGVRRFIHVSSSEVYGTALTVPMSEHHPTMPTTVYGASKLAGEAAARAFFLTYGLPTVVVRPFNNFGPRSHFEGDSGEVIPRFIVRVLADEPPIIFGDGEQTRDFIYVEDTAYWLRRIAESEAVIGATINLGSGVETSVNSIAGMICAVAAKEKLRPIHSQPRPGDVRRHLADVTLARELLGFKCTVNMKLGIMSTFEYFKGRWEHKQLDLSQLPAINW